MTPGDENRGRSCQPVAHAVRQVPPAYDNHDNFARRQLHGACHPSEGLQESLGILGQSPFDGLRRSVNGGRSFIQRPDGFPRSLRVRPVWRRGLASPEPHRPLAVGVERLDGLVRAPEAA